MKIVIGFVLVTALGFLMASESGANISVYVLPGNTAVAPSGFEKAVRVGTHGLLAASQSGRIVRLSPSPEAIIAAPTAKPVDSDGSPAEPLTHRFLSLGAIARGGTLIGNAAYSYGDATSAFGQTWVFPSGRPPHLFLSDSCGRYHKKRFEPRGFDDYDETVYDAKGEDIDVTESPNIYKSDISWPDRGAWAPYAFKVRRGRCDYYGRAVMFASTGDYSVGYREYHGAYLSSSTLAAAPETRDVAVRWRGNQLTELGPGVALDVAADGTAVGADAYSTYDLGNEPYVHARLWSASGAVTRIASDATASIAHAIDARHRVAGVLLRHNRYYAFLWQNGATRTIDDLVRDANWHFEAAFDFAPDGRIAGSGTYRGHPAVFLVNVP